MLIDTNVAALVRKAKLGDEEAFASLARRFLKATYAVALSIVGRQADAEDVSQDAFVTALSRIDTCRQEERFPGWLMQIVRNRAKNHLASRRLRDVPKKQVQDIREAGESPEKHVDTKKQLTSALMLLSPIQREIVLLHELENWSHSEIAEVTNITEGMSRQHLFTARRTLKERLVHFSTEEGQNV